jgi:hypothetical protein
MKRIVTLKVNGEPHEVAVPVHFTLLETLRYGLGLTGSKQGCDKGDCGACTVLLDGDAVLSCILPVWEAERPAPGGVRPDRCSAMRLLHTGDAGERGGSPVEE